MTKLMMPARIVVLILALATTAFAESLLTDQQIATIIVTASRDAYYRTGQASATRRVCRDTPVHRAQPQVFPHSLAREFGGECWNPVPLLHFTLEFA
jgi:hypothetical protein